MIILLPEVFLSISAFIMLMIGIFTQYSCTKLIKIIFALIYATALFLLIDKIPNGEIYVFDQLFKTDSIIKSFKMLLLFASILYILFMQKIGNPNNTHEQNFEFPVIVTLALVGMLCMLSANNFLSLYVSIELQSLSLYVLAAYDRDNTKSSEAGLKYFVLGSFASGILLFGTSLIYGFVGNLNFLSVKEILLANSSSTIAIAIITGIIMVLIGLFFKVSAAPFHMWTPDVYQGSPTLVTALFATLPKLAAMGVLARLSLEIFMPWKADLQPIFSLITIASVLIGSIGALKQNNFKRLLAYSSIGHVGYLLLCLTAFDESSMESLYLYLVIYLTIGEEKKTS